MVHQSLSWEDGFEETDCHGALRLAMTSVGVGALEDPPLRTIVQVILSERSEAKNPFFLWSYGPFDPLWSLRAIEEGRTDSFLAGP